MKRIVLTGTVMMGWLIFCGQVLSAEGALSPAERYFGMLESGLVISRSQMPAMVGSAEEAARRLMAGGRLYAAQGTQADLQQEALGRAGGLMGIEPVGKQQPGSKDVVLVGVREALGARECEAMGHWRAAGAYVVAFASGAMPQEQRSLADRVVTSGPMVGLVLEVDGQKKLCPVDTVLNAVNLWVWTGELVSACTRAGRMPVLYQSYGVEGGRERDDKYEGRTFHEDVEIRPMAAGLLGKAYLDTIHGDLLVFRHTQMDKLATAARWWRERGDGQAKAITLGHMFPGHFLDGRAPQKIALQSGDHTSELPSGSAGQFVLYCGYQYPPEKLAAQAAAAKTPLVYWSVQANHSSGLAGNIVYLDPCWPLADGCVDVPGYDIAILPASGVMDAAIYWALLAEVCDVESRK